MYIYAVIIIHNGRFRFLPSMCRLTFTTVDVYSRHICQASVKHAKLQYGGSVE